jgi:hypothetical protein
LTVFLSLSIFLFTLCFFDFAGFQALGADIGVRLMAQGINNAEFLYVRFERAFGTARDLAACAAFNPSHTAPGDVAAANRLFFTNNANF